MLGMCPVKLTGPILITNVNKINVVCKIKYLGQSQSVAIKIETIYHLIYFIKFKYTKHNKNY